MPKIMITDDSQLMKDIIRDIVEEFGYEAEFASSGEELLKKYVEYKPDIVILDIIMHGIDGIATLEELKKLDRNAKVLICSSIVGQEAWAKEAMEKGAYACLRKPFSVKGMLEAIEQGLKL